LDSLCPTRSANLAQNERLIMKVQEQMELSFNRMASQRRASRQGRLARARWWFTQMHRAVDRAFEWRSAPEGRPEQVYLTLSQGRS
jgi:hypothetical protein